MGRRIGGLRRSEWGGEIGEEDRERVFRSERTHHKTAGPHKPRIFNLFNLFNYLFTTPPHKLTISIISPHTS